MDLISQPSLQVGIWGVSKHYLWVIAIAVQRSRIRIPFAYQVKEPYVDTETMQKNSPKTPHFWGPARDFGLLQGVLLAQKQELRLPS